MPGAADIVVVEDMAADMAEEAAVAMSVVVIVVDISVVEASVVDILVVAASVVEVSVVVILVVAVSVVDISVVAVTMAVEHVFPREELHPEDTGVDLDSIGDGRITIPTIGD
jgi:hypothetical protein